MGVRFNIMGVAEKINEITRMMQTFDEKTIERYFEMAKRECSNEKVVAYTIQGEPLTKEMYIKRIKEADASVDAGKFVSSEELKKRMLSW